ncbi:MAG TPA: hypothetical protein VFE54_11270, partial [Mucilaginibacter sp.]|nr:hypothetical protein [Mucilaginibacter sp.]
SLSIAMKQQFFLALIILIASFEQYAIAQNKVMKDTPENKLTATLQKEDILGAGIFKALKENSSSQWLSLYPTDAEYKDILQQMLAAKVEELTQQHIDEMLEQRKQEATLAYTAEFKNFIHQADSLGIKWKDAVFEKFHYQAMYPEKVKLKYLNGDIYFSSSDNHFVIEGIEALQLPDGYRLQNVKGIKPVPH